MQRFYSPAAQNFLNNSNQAVSKQSWLKEGPAGQILQSKEFTHL